MRKTDIYRQLLSVGCSESHAEYMAEKNGEGVLDKTSAKEVNDKPAKKSGVLSRVKETFKNGNA